MDKQHTYTYDVKFFASVSVTAASRKEGRAKLAEVLEQANLDLGTVDGKALSAGVDIEGEQILTQIDGEDVQ